MTLTNREEKEMILEILEVKKQILKMIYVAQSGHPGGSLSCASLIYLLYKRILRFDFSNPCWNERDIFILSKGHAVPALYAVFAEFGLVDKRELLKLRTTDSIIQGHPMRDLSMGIEVSTGSLGMGLSIGVGSALAAKLDNKKDKRVYVLMGDGELNEGSIWEAAMAASHYKLDNLIAIIDRNGIQIDGATEEIMALEPLAEKWRSFGWQVIEVDGSKIKEVLSAFEKAKSVLKKPIVIISYLIKGGDVSFMEHTHKYHGRPPNKEEFDIAMTDIEKTQTEIKEDD